MAGKKSTKVANKAAAKPVLLSGGNPQIAKADGDPPRAGLYRAHARLKKRYRPPPRPLIVRNVPNVRKAMDEWAFRRGIRLRFVRPGKPVENAFAESFNGRLRDECLNINWFMSVRHAGEVIESWRQDYNEVRPPTSLKGMTPKEFADSMAGLY